MKKQFLYFSIVFLLFFTVSYTYSAFKSSISANITANVKDWAFNVNVNNAAIENDSYKLHLTGTSGSFTINLSTLNSTKGADYTIELIGDNSIKFYTDSSYTKLINNNIYSGFINNNTSSSVTIYYKSDTAINSDILIKTKGTIMEIATMKNGYSGDSSANGGTEFWSDNYKPYIRTITFGNDLSNLPSSCTEENLCWDISESSTQKNKVYGYLVDTGLKDSEDNTKPLYNLYIVSGTVIFAPSSCESIFQLNKYVESTLISNLTQINFNDNFNTSNVANMSRMFFNCRSLISLDLSSFNITNVTNMLRMFHYCSSLTSLDLSSFNTTNVMNMGYMFAYCSSLTNLDLSSFNTSKVTKMNTMFSSCTSLTNLDLSSFNTANVTEMQYMFNSCSSLISLNLSSFNSANVTDMGYMFSGCSSLTNLDLSSFNTSKVRKMDRMFKDCSSLTTTINIMNMNAYVITHTSMFSGAATDANAKITVNYISSASKVVDKMIATKSSNSNVVKGVQIN